MTHYVLINKDSSFIEFSNFADLYNAFLREYGFPTVGAKAIEGERGNYLFYWA